MAARRWLLFGLSLASLLAMTYAGVSLAYSQKVTPEMAEANPEAKLGARMVLRVYAHPDEVRTVADDGEGDLLASGEPGPSFLATAAGVELGRALVFVAPDENGTYTPATFVDGRNETVNVTAFVAAAGGTGEGWIVQGAGESEPRFVPLPRALGTVERFENATLLPALFAGGLLGFVTPLVVIVLTHRGTGRRGPPPRDTCAECRAPLAASADFCTRCGAYARRT